MIKQTLGGTGMINKTFQAGGSEYIAKIIDDAVKDGSRNATVKGNWEIASAIRIPSNFTLILDSCHLRMADGCYSNLFINEHHDTVSGRTIDGTDHNISIIGRGEAILDGGTYNGLSEKNQLKDGLPPIWKNNLLLFTNVDGFKISNLSFHNQRWWALNFIFCSNGHISEIDFQANDMAIDENGNIYHGFKRSKYLEVLVKNADGIDLRQGCHDIVIENITGFTEDDSIALTGVNGKLEQTFFVNGLPTDICNVTIKNINTASYCTNVRLLNQGDVCLHDILIDGVYDMSENSSHMDRGIYTVRVGDPNLYGSRQSTRDETYNITIKNVRSRAEYAVQLCGGIRNLIMENVEAFDGAQLIEDIRTEK